MKLNNETELRNLATRGALFVVNHSGGKDSQAMMVRISQIAQPNQILVIHADLPGADWSGCWDHIQTTCKGYEIRKTVAHWDKKGPHQGAVKTFMGMVSDRKMWPSPTTRNCTSDLKRDPIAKVVRHYIKENRLSGLVVNCMGIRAEEGRINKDGKASGRAMGLDKSEYKRTGKAVTLCTDNRNSKAGREYYQAYPIFDMKISEVWDTISRAGQEPHPIYAKGMSRLSCMFCIMASKNDLTIAAKLVPDVYKSYCEKERELDFTFAMPTAKGKQFLPEITGIDPDNNPGLDGTERQDSAPQYDDMDCGGWERSQDDTQQITMDF